MMNFDIRSGLLLSTAIFGVTVMAEAAMADTTAEMETITVTATKTNERQIDVALPVTAVDTQALLATNSVHLEDYALRIPGISVTSQGNGRASAIIRGVTSGLANNPTVGITIDDVPIGSSTSGGIGDSILPDIDPGVLSSVEVLRGPQGSLYGAASMGGLIRYVTSSPNLSSTYGQLGVSGASSAHGNEGYGIRGFVNTPIIDGTLAVQASSFYRVDPGYVDNIRTDHEDANLSRSAGGRLALLWQINSKVSYELAGIIQSRKSGYSSRIDVSFDRKPLNASYYESDRIPGTNGGRMNLGIYSGTLRADLGSADLTAITAYSRSAFDGPQDASASFDRFLGFIYPAAVVPTLDSRIDNFAQTGKFTQEVRLSSKSGSALEWMMGAFMTRETSLSEQAIFATTAKTGVTYDDNYLYTVHDPSSYTEYAAFASVTYHFTQAFDLQLGGRVSQQRQTYLDALGGILNGGDTVDQGEESSSVFTYSITPRYHLSDNMMVYGRVATGYRPGGVNTAPDAPGSYGPDRTVNYEVGFKGIVVDGLLTVDASLFDIEWNKIQLEAASPTNFSYVQNGGTARSMGFEVAAYLTPGDGWTIGANFSLVDATLQKDIAVSSLYGLKGQRLPYSSKTAGSLSVDKSFPLTADITATLGGAFNYQGSRYAAFPTNATNARFFMPAYGTLDLQAGLEYQDWKMSFYAKNVFDQVGFTYGQSRNVATRAGNYDAAIIAPRTIGVSLTQNF